MFLIWVSSKMYYWCNDTAERDRILKMLAASGETKVDVYSLSYTADLTQQKYH